MVSPKVPCSFLFHSVCYKKENVFVSCNIHSYALVSKMVLAEALCFQCGF